jgi:hypothetical protein
MKPSSNSQSEPTVSEVPPTTSQNPKHAGWPRIEIGLLAMRKKAHPAVQAWVKNTLAACRRAITKNTELPNTVKLALRVADLEGFSDEILDQRHEIEELALYIREPNQKSWKARGPAAPKKANKLKHRGRAVKSRAQLKKQDAIDRNTFDPLAPCILHGWLKENHIWEDKDGQTWNLTQRPYWELSDIDRRLLPIFTYIETEDPNAKPSKRATDFAVLDEMLRQRMFKPLKNSKNDIRDFTKEEQSKAYSKIRKALANFRGQFAKRASLLNRGK